MNNSVMSLQDLKATDVGRSSPQMKLAPCKSYNTAGMALKAHAAGLSERLTKLFIDFQNLGNT
ncbi:hypothetical protein GL2_00260 [Microbulbifer sp. GL-2]|nr:hypothetical protein GL2_00260 [Microbulbifer sp. GL-2]